MNALLLAELRLVLRGGFVGAYVVVCIAYLAVLHALPAPLFDRLLPVLVFSDPAVLGLWVVGAMVLLERQEGALQALAHTPTPPGVWVAAKGLVLTGGSVVVGTVVAVGSGALVRPDLLLLALVPTSGLSVFVGLLCVSRASTFNRFVALSAVVTTPLALPALALAGVVPLTATLWVPTGATALLLQGAFGEPVDPELVGVCVAWQIVCTAGFAAWAVIWTRRHLWRRA